MNLQQVKLGDMVLIDKRGRRFHALVVDRGEDLGIQPIDPKRNPYFTATAREVVDLWKHYQPRSRSNNKET